MGGTGVGEHGLVNGDGRTPQERGVADRAALNLAGGAVRAPARVEVEDDLALERQHRDHALLETVADLVRLLDAPEFGNHEMGVNVVKASRANRAQVMQADDSRLDAVVVRVHDPCQQIRVLLVEQAARRVAQKLSAGPGEVSADDSSDERIEDGLYSYHSLELVRKRIENPELLLPLVEPVPVR